MRNKRKLSALPREQATADMIDIADRLGSMRHIVTASLTEDGEVLQVSFYRISDLQEGKTEAELRTFFSRDDYITQDLKQTETKWLTGALDRLEGVQIFRFQWNRESTRSECLDNVYIRSAEEKELMVQFFRDYAAPDEKHAPWAAISRFQDEVREKRLFARHRKEMQEIDEFMAPFTDPPQEFFNWIWEKGMSFSRYLIYHGTKKGKAECECTCCGKSGTVDRKEIRLRHNEKGVCPFCGSPVTIKAGRVMEGEIHDQRTFAYVDTARGAFTIRYFNVSRDIKSDKRMETSIFPPKRVEQCIHEFLRHVIVFDSDQGKAFRDGFEWARFKGKGPERWCRERVLWNVKSILYPGNLPEAWKNTPMKYSALEIFAEHFAAESKSYETAISRYLKFPKLEWLIKMGMYNLAGELIGSYSGAYLAGKVNEEANTIYGILGLNKVNTRILQQIDGGNYELRLLQVAQNYRLQLTPEELEEFYKVFECNTALMEQAGKKKNLHRIMKYIDRESENYQREEDSHVRYTGPHHSKDPHIEKERNMANDWLDYLGWCDALGYDLNDMFIYMPNNFKAVHDRTEREYTEYSDRQAAIKKAMQEKLAKETLAKTRIAMQDIFRQNNGVDAFSIRGKGLVLVVPASADEIRKEGQTLHHCVATYVDRVANGETNIFFVRKEDEPETPYYTMEFRNGKVIQCRGSHNCSMTPEVEAFVNVFEKKMQDEAAKTDRENRVQLIAC